MNNYRLEIEQLILVSFLNQDTYMNELDKIEYEEYKLPYELFKSNRTNKLIAKAIFNLQEEKKPVSDLMAFNYVLKHTEINEAEYLNLISKLPVGFDTMKKYLIELKKIDSDEEKLKVLGSM